MADITRLWFIHNYADAYYNHSIKGPMVFTARENAELAIDEAHYKTWSVSSWGVDENLKFKEDIKEAWRPVDGDSVELLKGAIWLQDLREREGVVIDKMAKVKKEPVVAPEAKVEAKVDTKLEPVGQSEADALRSQLKDMGVNPRNIKNVAKLRQMVEAAYSQDVPA
jgi:hypothetical protein